MRRRGSDWAKVRHRVARGTGSDGGRDRGRLRGLLGASCAALSPRPSLGRKGGTPQVLEIRATGPVGSGMLGMAASHSDPQALPVPTPCWAPGQGEEQGPGAGGQSPYPELLSGGREGCGSPGKASLHSPVQGAFRKGVTWCVVSWCQVPCWAVPGIQLGVRTGLGSGDGAHSCC